MEFGYRQEAAAQGLLVAQNMALQQLPKIANKIIAVSLTCKS